MSRLVTVSRSAQSNVLCVVVCGWLHLVRVRMPGGHRLYSMATKRRGASLANFSLGPHAFSLPARRGWYGAVYSVAAAKVTP